MAPKLLTSKRRREAEKHGRVTDRMSSLPDSVLCHILSFLPTKTSVATMTLVSRKWRHLWQRLQVFDFADDSNHSVRGSKKFEKFALFVNAVLGSRKSRDIRKFQLNCFISTSQHVCEFRRHCANRWIRAAINPSLEELSLSITDYCWDSNLLLPRSLLNCTNLVSLSLVGAIKMNVQGFELHFPSLKSLKLGSDIVDSEFLLLSACPILETLQHVCFVPKTCTEVPLPPSSERLNFTHGSFSWSFLEAGYYCNGYRGKGSKTSFGDIGNAYLDSTSKTTFGIIGNLQSMVNACIDFFPSQGSEFVDPILNCLQDPLNVLHIQLRHSISKCALRPQILNYPEFRNLVHLKFILPCFNSNLLVNVLDKCHMIQVLIIQNNKEEQPPLRTWDPNSTTVPKGLKFHLKYIHIEGYQGFEDELTFAEYILQNGFVLETMLIFVDTSMEQTNKYCSLKRLNDIPRRSSKCQLKFDPAVSS
ncbi:putative F-box/FBD/LRR-repeat protein At5g56810 isoform X2 [Vicia villosa]|uniref:putative F-box/FBD/LRR-repeat protein At5g56810 isoform X2 n=1 Tax=Vicia villosa TaxID=3911 RepID=UPI00273CB48E|nr:putative F-box/FBD/LRR-repeat protein At5g56810 isoform X2 [Vicia villosa]